MPDRKKSIVIYTDLIQHLEMLSTEEVGSVFLGILNYAEYGEIPNLTSAAGMCFSFIRSQIDRDSDKWERTREKRIASGRAGGIASGESRSTAKQNEANEANAYSSKQNEANEAVTVPVTVNGTVNGTVNKSINSADKPRRFTKPKDDLDTAVDYFKEHRKKLKKPMTDHAVDIFRKRLEKLAPGDATKKIELIDYAIVKGWQDVYIPDESGNQTSKTPEPKKAPKPRTFVLTEDGGLKYDDEP